MKIDNDRIGSVTVLLPHGAIALDDVEEFAQAIEEQRQKTNGRFVIELTNVPFIDSQGLETLWDIADYQREGGKTIKLSGIQEVCREIFELTGMSEHLDLFDTSENAVRSFL